MTNSEITSNAFLDNWIKYYPNLENITHIHTIPQSTGNFDEFPAILHPAIQRALTQIGINSLYKHQTLCFQLIQTKNNVLINTGTASGKTLSFFLPILNDFFYSDGIGNALFLFPTKALSNDQLQQYKLITSSIDVSKFTNNPLPSISAYDGDTPKGKRIEIRKGANFLLTNPDMLHFAILPYHTLWEHYFRNLKYVVIDEIHAYRGVFGSHVANILRRLKRISHFYGRKLQFIATSATIGNPKEFVENLLEEKISLVNENFSPYGEKSIIFYNPPIENEKLGIRKSALQETMKVSHDFAEKNIQTLVFEISRKSVEKSLKLFNEIFRDKRIKPQAYRSGYLAQDRRNIESQLRTGEIKLLFSTNALELGMDIGGISNVILCGYPGSVTSTLQQIGRAGRKTNRSSAIFIANASPIDQFLIKHPEYILLKSPESALIDPNNYLILYNHLRCSASELMFETGDKFGDLNWETIMPFLEEIGNNGELLLSDNRYYWISSQQPVLDISLRNMGGNVVKLIDQASNKIIGQVDYTSSLWMVHEGAVYMQQGEDYLVKELDLINNKAILEKRALNYFTNAKRETKIEFRDILEKSNFKQLEITFGEIEVNNKIIAYDEFLWDSNEKISTKELELPAINLSTQAVWFSLSENMIGKLRDQNLWLNDQNNYGENWNEIKEKIRIRDNFQCQACGIKEDKKNHHVHHLKPLRLFENVGEANKFSNLVTLCPKCHNRIEMNVRVRSGLGGLKYITKNMAPLFLMCDFGDIDVYIDPSSSHVNGKPLFLFYDNISFGIGLSHHMFEILPLFFANIMLHISECPCQNGCPSCVGPEPEFGYGGKLETMAILKAILE